MTNSISKLGTLFCLFILMSCTDNNKQNSEDTSSTNENDKLHDSLSSVFYKKKNNFDSLNASFEDELAGQAGSNKKGPIAEKLQSEVELLQSELSEIAQTKDSIFSLTSTHYKINHYKKTLNELNESIKENEAKLKNSKKSFEDELAGQAGSTGYGIEAKLKESLIKEIAEEIAAKEKMKDSINQILKKLK